MKQFAQNCVDGILDLTGREQWYRKPSRSRYTRNSPIPIGGEFIMVSWTFVAQ